jgi:hypothetical protein
MVETMVRDPQVIFEIPPDLEQVILQVSSGDEKTRIPVPLPAPRR